MKGFYILCKNLPEGVDRHFFLKIFQNFGKIIKVYVQPNLEFSKIYFAEQECAEQALSLHKTAPHYLHLSLASEEVNTNRKKKESAATPPASFMSVANETMSSNGDFEDFYGDAGPNYYNIHGICVPTVMGEDGTLYVSLNDVKRVGFELFPEDNIPKNINLDKKRIEELKLYLAVKARKYLRNMNFTMLEKDVQKAANDTINGYIINKTLNTVTKNNNSSITPVISHTNNNAFQSSQTNRSGKQSPNSSFTKSGFERNKAMEEDQHTPLRRPIDNQNSKPLNIDFIHAVDKNASNKNVSNITENNTVVEECNKDLIKRIELPLHKPIDVIVAHINSDRNCFVYRASDKDKLETLMYKTNITSANSISVKPCLGKLCACTYQGVWYRAVVHQVTPALKVQYVDFGNFNDEVVKEVRELSECIRKEALLAVEIKFALKPRNSLEDSAELKIVATKKNDDGSYLVEEVTSKTTSNTLEPLPAGVAITLPSSSKRKPKISISERQPVNHHSTPRVVTPNSTHSSCSNLPVSDNIETISPSKTLKEKLKILNPTKESNSAKFQSRKSVADVFNEDNGQIQFIRRLGKNSCLVFILSTKFMADLEALEDITYDQTSPTVKHEIGDAVSVLNNEGKCVRGVIIAADNNEYSVALIDYGEIVLTEKVSRLQKRFVDIPDFISVCSGNPECIDYLEKNNEAEYTSHENNTVQISFDNAVYNVTVNCWSPYTISKTDSDTSVGEIFTYAPQIKEIKDGEVVLPVILNNGSLLVRSKETNSLLRKINQNILSYKASSLTQTPIEGQMITCGHDTQFTLCRGVVKTVKDNYVEVEFIDYGFVDTVPVKKIMSISKDLAHECQTLISMKLKHFENGDFPQKAIEFLESYIKSGKKFTAKKHGDNVFDLLTHDTSNESLSSKLQTFIGTNKIITAEDISRYTLKDGDTQNLVCIDIQDNGSIVFVLMNSDLCNLSESIAKYAENNTEPYSPEIGEICLAILDEEWFRANVEEINRALEEYLVYFIDFGNRSRVNINGIRKIPIELTKLPAHAIHCRLSETMNAEWTPEVLNAIKNNIVVGNCYDVTVVQKTRDNIHEVRIGSVLSE